LRKGKPRILVRAFRTRYWRPGTDFIAEIIKAIGKHARDGDFLAISEKAICTSLGRIVDEARIKPSSLSKALALWVKWVWGYFLGPFCHLRPETIAKLRSYPIKEGAAHKQVALRLTGLLTALTWGSEGGIDGSNLPFSYVSIPLEPREATRIARWIAKQVRSKLGIHITVLIVDSDRTYRLGPLYISPRLTAIRGIIGGLGIIAYLLGNALGLKSYPTPVASSRPGIAPELALRLASAASKVMGHGAGRDVWEMASRFGVGLTGVTWGMLSSVEHRPIVLIRILWPRGSQVWVGPSP